MKPNLKVVPADDQPVDLYARWKAEIRARDWDRVAIDGDRRAAVDLPERRRVKVFGMEVWR